MKLLFDKNLPPALVKGTRVTCPGSAHVHDCGLVAVDDGKVWDYAKTGGLVIVTKDSDYEERNVLPGTPPKVIWLRTGNCTTGHLVALLAMHAKTIHVFASDDFAAVLEIS
jgi:predicted nuclease of predicted toxin-antitoxin system